MTPSAEDLPAPTTSPALALAPAPEPEPEPEPEAVAWAEVLAGWDDEDRHRAYLARFADLEGLATAGGRYRAVLAQRPADPIAARFRDEVVRRAVARGLAMLPRARPAPSRRALRIAASLVVGAMLALAGWAALQLLSRGAHA